MMLIWLFTPIYGLLILTICGGNALVILSVIITKTMRNLSNILIVSLSCADLAVGLVVLPMRLSELLQAPWTKSINYCRLSHCFSLLNLSASILNIIAITLDRYFATHVPYRYDPLAESRRFISILTSSIWAVALLIAFLPMIGLGSNHKQGPRDSQGICRFSETLNDQYLTAYLIIIVFTSACIILVVYFRLFQLATRHMKDIASTRVSVPSNQSELESSDPSQEQGRSHTHNPVENRQSSDAPRRNRRRFITMQLKAAKTMAFIFGLFFACWISFVVGVTVTVICRSCSNAVMVLTTSSLVFANSAVNPIIYYGRMQQYRKAFRKVLTLLGCCCRKLNAVEGAQ